MTQKQILALSALLQTNSRAEAARAAGVSERTVRNYWNDPEFRREYATACRDQLREATQRAQYNATAAVDTLTEIMQDEEQPPNVRIQATRALIDATLRLSEVVDIDERLTALEKGRIDERFED